MDTQQEYIDQKTKEFAMNIAEFSIGQDIFDHADKHWCKITGKTSNSIEVFIPRKNIEHGVDSKQWFDMRNFNKKFIK